MSIKRSILANYISQLYVTVIGVVMVPVYVKHMGAEAYGLVGFFAMLQAWFQLLDMGLTLTMMREAARFTGCAIDSINLRRLLRSMEGVFVVVALIGCATLILMSGFIAAHWLKLQQLSVIDVQYSIVLMAIAIGFRWISGLYRGVIAGFDDLVWLSVFNSIVATARFVVVVPYFVLFGAEPVSFFLYQLLIAFLEAAVLLQRAYRLLPSNDKGWSICWEWAHIKESLSFSATISFASLAWIIATQTDKLLLSKLLDLKDYGYFTVVALVSTGLAAIASPVSGAVLPRLTKLFAEGDEGAFAHLYRRATRFVVMITAPATAVLVFFPSQVLWVWTGNALLVDKAASVLSLYAAGSGLSVIAAFPYYMQYAKGKLRLHLVGSCLFILAFLPSLLYLVPMFGMFGAAVAWLIVNGFYFLFWIPVVYKYIAPAAYWPWLFNDVLTPSLPSLGASCMLLWFMRWPTDRTAAGIQLAAVCGLLFLVSVLSNSEARQYIRSRILSMRRA